MSVLTERYRIPASGIPWICLEGAPIVGRALESPFFQPYEVPATVTVAELLATAKQRRQSVIRRVVFMGKKGGVEQAAAIHAKTLKEVAQGSMAGPYTDIHEELVEQFGEFYNVIPSLGLHQGHNEDGLPKFRRIDDHTAGHTNLAATRTQRISMAMADYLVVMMISALFKRFPERMKIGTEDMPSAYRQLPLPDGQTGTAIIAVYEPEAGEAKLFALFGQPFGAGHAVPSF